jgi:hypothetical protein
MRGLTISWPSTSNTVNQSSWNIVLSWTILSLNLLTTNSLTRFLEAIALLVAISLSLSFTTKWTNIHDHCLEFHYPFCILLASHGLAVDLPLMPRFSIIIFNINSPSLTLLNSFPTCYYLLCHSLLDNFLDHNFNYIESLLSSELFHSIFLYPSSSTIKLPPILGSHKKMHLLLSY